MCSLSQHAARGTLALVTGLLLSAGSAAHAQEPEPRPPVPNLAPESPVAPSGHPASASTPRATVITGPTAASVQPTLRTENNRMAWPNKALLATGATVFGVAYLPAIVGGALSDADRRKDLYVPIAGPWLMLTRGEQETRGVKALLVLDGVAQSLGALMLMSSLFVPERATKSWYLIGANRTLLAPARVGSGYGLGAHSRF
jgi:hypothetical protein